MPAWCDAVTLRRRLLPRRISGQIALLLLASVAVTYLAVVGAVVATRPEPDPLGPPIAFAERFITTVRLVEVLADAGERERVVALMNRRFPSMAAQLDPPAAAGVADTGTAAFLRHALGPGFRVAATADAGPPSGGHRVLVVLADGTRVAGTLPRMDQPPFLVPFAGIIVVAAISLLALFLWATRWLTAPLTAFARAAAEFGPDRAHEPLPDVGPEEIRTAAAALNRMRARITDLVADRTRMLAAVGHDLRTPITRLRLRAEFIADPAMRREMLRDLDRMGTLVEDALAYLRDSDSRDAHWHAGVTPLDLPALLQTVCDGFADLGNGDGVAARVAYEGPDRLEVRGHPDDLARAFENLIDNAVKYGGGATVRLAPGPDGGAVIEIRDEGPGIPADARQRMLAPFVRGDAARGAGERDGFGLGLSIAGAIVAAHGGTLTLEDGVPRGLTVRITLPARPATTAERT